MKIDGMTDHKMTEDQADRFRDDFEDIFQMRNYRQYAEEGRKLLEEFIAYNASEYHDQGQATMLRLIRLLKIDNILKPALRRPQ